MSSFKRPEVGDYWEFSYNNSVDYATYTIKVLDVFRACGPTEWDVEGQIINFEKVSDKRLQQSILAVKQFTISKLNWRRVNVNDNTYAYDMYDTLEEILYSS